MSPPTSAGNTPHPGLWPRSVQYASMVVPSEHAAHRADCSVQHAACGAPLGPQLGPQLGPALDGPALGGLDVLCHAGRTWFTWLGWGFRVLLLLLLLLLVGLMGPIIMGPDAPVAPVIGDGAARIARGAGGENKLEKNPPIRTALFSFYCSLPCFFLRGFFHVTLQKKRRSCGGALGGSPKTYAPQTKILNGSTGLFLVDRRNYTEWPLHESCNKAQ